MKKTLLLLAALSAQVVVAQINDKPTNVNGTDLHNSDFNYNIFVSPKLSDSDAQYIQSISAINSTDNGDEYEISIFDQDLNLYKKVNFQYIELPYQIFSNENPALPTYFVPNIFTQTNDLACVKPYYTYTYVTDQDVNGDGVINEYDHGEVPSFQGFKVVSPDGELATLTVDNADSYSLDTYKKYAYLQQVGDKYYLFLQTAYGAEKQYTDPYSGESYTYTDFEPSFVAYQIDRANNKLVQMNSIEAMRIFPNLINRNQPVGVDVEAADYTRQMIITDNSGKVLQCETVAAGQTHISVPTSNLNKGIYNFTLVGNGQTTTGRVVVK